MAQTKNNKTKSTKPKRTSLGWKASYIGKGEHVRSLPNVYLSEEFAKRALRREGVSDADMRVSEIKK